MPGATLTERDAELAAVAAAVAHLDEPRGAALCVLAPAGTGKTALLAQASALAARRGAAVWAASARPLLRHAPYAVLREVLEEPIHALDDTTRTRLREGPAASALALLLGGATAADAATMQASFSWLLRELVTAPVVIVVDDAHWADEGSLRVLTRLADRLDSLPIVLVVAAREVRAERRSAALAALVAHRSSRVVRPAALSERGVRRVLAARWHRAPTALEVAHVVALTDGNPFLVDAVSEFADPRGAVPPVGVPGSVVDEIVHRVGSLGPEAVAVARAVAVLVEATHPVVAATADLPLTAVTAACDDLREAAVLRDAGTVEFRHALLRQAVEATTPAGEHDALRRRAARSIAADPSRLHEAAAHLIAVPGVGDAWAVGLLRRAASDAIAAGAPEEAVVLLQRARLEPPPPDADIGVRLELGLAQLRAGDPACVTTLESAVTAHAPASIVAHAALGAAAAHGFQGAYGRAADILEAARPALREGDADLRLIVEAALASAEQQVPGRVERGRARVAAHAGLAGANAAERRMLTQQAVAAIATNAPGDAVRALARRAMHPDDDPTDIEWMLPRLLLVDIGDYVDAREAAEHGLSVARRAGSPWGEVLAGYVRAVALQRQGELSAAEAQYRTALDGGGSLSRLVGHAARAGLLEVLADRGALAQLRGILHDVERDDAEAGNPNGRFQLLYARAHAQLVLGDDAGARECAVACGRELLLIDADSPTLCPWRPLAVAAALRGGDRAEARRLAAEHLALAERSDVAPVLGAALRAVGAAEASVDALERSVQVLDRTPARLELARSLVALGGMLRRTGSPAAARAPLLRGRALAHDCGAVPLQAEADDELAMAGGRPRRIHVEGVGSLTASEGRTARLAATGLSNREIANRLFLAPKTVEMHLSRVYRKLGIGSREHLPGAIGDDPASAK